MTEKTTGGCQCGAVRYCFLRLGRASICHCRMCQKAFGGFFGPLVTVHGLVWTRGEPARFASSDSCRRGFCQECGTPLTFEYEGGLDVSIGSLDDPEMALPEIQLSEEDKCSYVDRLADLPVLTGNEKREHNARNAAIQSHQHPDHDT